MRESVRAVARGVRAGMMAIVAAAGCATAGGAPADPAGAPHTVLLVSDLHFNPFADTSLVRTLRGTPTSGWARVLARTQPSTPSKYGADTNYPLLRSAGAAMKQAAPAPAFVVITGDFLAHQYQERYEGVFSDTVGYAAFTDSTIAFLAKWADSLYPNVPIYPAIGNNDSDCGDYAVVANGQFLRSAARSWGPLAQRGGGSPGFATSFAAAGHYTARVPATGTRLVMVNDVFLSRDYDTSCGEDLGGAELDWLGAALDSAKAAGERAWIAGHIPPGVDVYSTISQQCSSPTCLLFDAAYNARYDSIVRANAGVVALSLTGHTHMNEFRVHSAGPSGRAVPIVGVPAVSPLFKNNPGFAVLELTARGEPANYSAYAFSGTWAKLFDFGSTYHQRGVTGASILAAAQRISADTAVRTRWRTNYDGGRGVDGPTASNWKSYWCAIANLAPSDYAKCVGP